MGIPEVGRKTYVKGFSGGLVPIRIEVGRLRRRVRQSWT